jgi:hypothetical protein
MLSHSPSVVTSNLLLCLDAANPKSYNKYENLLRYSEDFSNVVWSRTSTTISANAAVDPNGYFTADKLIGNNGITSRKSTYQTYSEFTAGTTYIFSIYLKQAGFTNAMIWFDTANSSPNAYMGAGSLINLAAGTVAGSQTTIVNASNGWYRCYITFTATVSGSYNLQISLGDANGNGTATGDGVSGIYLWGAQLEIDTSLTDYTKTISTAIARSTSLLDTSGNGYNFTLNNPSYYSYDNTTKSINFTRDASTKIGGYAVRNTSGLLSSQTYLYNDHTTEVWARINDSAPGNYDATETFSALIAYQGFHCMFLYNSTVLRYSLWTNTGPANPMTSSLVIGTDIIVGNWFQVVVTKSGSIFKTYLNGVLKKTDTIDTIPFTGVQSVLRIGAANVGSYSYYSKSNISNVKMYNRALTELEIKQNFNALRGRFGL